MSEAPSSIRITAEGVVALAATEREIDHLSQEIAACDQRAQVMALELAIKPS